MANISQDQSITISLPAGKQLTVSTDAVSTGRVIQMAQSAGGQTQGVTAIAASASTTFGPFTDTERFKLECLTGTLTYSDAKVDFNTPTEDAADDAATYMPLSDDRFNEDSLATDIGALATAPVSGTVAVDIVKVGPHYRLDFTLTAAQIPVTDAGGSGSFGALALFDFVEGSYVFKGSRQDYTAFAEGAALTGGAGDAAFEIGLGTTEITAAADGSLAAGEDNIGGDVNVTLSGGTGTGTAVEDLGVAVNGTETAPSLYLNFSGSAATIDANSTIDVTGTLSVLVAALGDD